MGLYSAALMSGGGLAAVLGPHISGYFGHWQVGLGVWAIPAVLAVLAWAVLRPRQEAAKLAGAAGGHWFGTRRAWSLALYLA